MNADPKSCHILIADDQADVLQALRLLFKGEGHSTESVGSPIEVLQSLGERDFDLLLMDLNYSRDTTSGKEGLELLQKVLALDDALPVVVMTAWGSVELAVEAVRRGAKDFIQKPWDNPRLLTIVRNQIELGQALRSSRRLEAAQTVGKGSNFIAESPAMQPVKDMIARVGPSDATILITGANGTGKGLVARAVHAVSNRAQKPLVSVNMGGLSEGVFESEFFGHVKGAFTDAKKDRMGRIEMAEGGTLFLDEIANVPAGQQAKLLRILETGEYERVGSSKTRNADVRIISATNANLAEEVNEGRFRQDLLFRLNTVEIHLPPLTARREDVPPLAHFFLGQYCRRYQKQIETLDAHVLAALQAHDWPGNVRELSHVIERAVLMTSGNRIQINDLGLARNQTGASSLDEMSIEEVERYLIRRALARSEGNARQAAEALGLSRSAFYRRLEKYGL